MTRCDVLSRWMSGLLLVTLPVWFLPACTWIGFREAGLTTLREVPMAFRWAFLGKLP